MWQVRSPVVKLFDLCFCWLCAFSCFRVIFFFLLLNGRGQWGYEKAVLLQYFHLQKYWSPAGFRNQEDNALHIFTSDIFTLDMWYGQKHKDKKTKKNKDQQYCYVIAVSQFLVFLVTSPSSTCFTSRPWPAFVVIRTYEWNQPG